MASVEKQVLVIEIEVRNALLEYLATKPYNEVQKFITILAQAPAVNVTVTENAPQPPAIDDKKLASAARPTGKKTPANKKGAN